MSVLSVRYPIFSKRTKNRTDKNGQKRTKNVIMEITFTHLDASFLHRLDSCLSVISFCNIQSINHCHVHIILIIG